MRAEFASGSAVSRVYPSGDDAELIAVFAYQQDAEAFARSRLDEDKKHNLVKCYYIVANGYDGRLTIFKAEAPATVLAA